MSFPRWTKNKQLLNKNAVLQLSKTVDEEETSLFFPLLPRFLVYKKYQRAMLSWLCTLRAAIFESQLGGCEEIFVPPETSDLELRNSDVRVQMEHSINIHPGARTGPMPSNSSCKCPFRGGAYSGDMHQWPRPCKITLRLLQWKFDLWQSISEGSSHSSNDLLKLQVEISVKWSGQAFREDVTGQQIQEPA